MSTCSNAVAFLSDRNANKLIAVAQPQQNRLLAALSLPIREQLYPRLQRVWLPAGTTLHGCRDNVDHVYFPTSALISLSAALDDGSCTQIAEIGSDGLVGLALIMGGESSPMHAQVLEAGCAFHLRKSQLMELFAITPALQQTLLRYAQAHLTQVAQLAACNCRHSLEQQFCRWLLLRLDRRDSHLILTHETIGSLLGVRRESISQVCGRLQKLHVLRCSRGKIDVIDRAQLELLSCECYFLMRKENDRLIPAMPARLPIRASLQARPGRPAAYAFGHS